MKTGALNNCMGWFLQSLTCSTCQILVSLLLINYSSRHCSSFESKGLNLMLILSVFASLSCAMKDGAFHGFIVSITPSGYASVWQAAERRTDGPGLPWQHRSSIFSQLEPFSLHFSLSVNRTPLTTYILYVQLLFLLPFSCHDAVFGVLEVPFSLSLNMSDLLAIWTLRVFCLNSVMADVHMKMLMNIFLD